MSNTNTNPDNKVTTSTLETFGLSVPIGILYGIILTVLFLYSDSIPFFKIILWIIFPILVFFIGSIINIINQYTSCKTIDAGKAFLGAIPSLIGVLIAMGCGMISYCRIPIISVFAPFVLDNDINITGESKSGIIKNGCCSNKISLSQVEEQYPQLKGVAIGFYVLFGVLFGNVFGTGISSIC